MNPEDYELQMSYLRNMSCVEANRGVVARWSPFFWDTGAHLERYPHILVCKLFRSPTFFDGRIIVHERNV